MATIEMDSVEGFQLKHGSLIGGARKGCLCLSLRLAVFLHGLLNIILLFLTISVLFSIPIGLLGSNQEEVLPSGSSHFEVLNRFGLNAVNLMNKYLPRDLLLIITEIIRFIRGSTIEGKFVAFTLDISILSSLVSIFGVFSKSMGLIKFSIFAFLISQLLTIFGIFYAPTLGKLYNLKVLSNPVLLLSILILVMFYTMWYSHLLYSYYKVLRAGGSGGEYLSYREIIDRRNFLRWKTWKERELERGSPYNPSFSRSSEKDRLLK
ncbi:unnamed protein product [Cryptosporidium hominis]|uniref:Uncharacterized protein n=1 Tax=Cryptosporidium hominis TaxID=237895 RepID=A0A0S4TJ92_CRYHO|nr:hypothetical protein [Cryptosporidium hominis TU502]OLQ17990.1 putative integral membrane protein [Cryptosporidium hominis]PPA64050.1 hypothetical protein ChUKH1_04565 [Cryptosporidium hominis]PPS93919.1 Uncharacterized protein GY17_00003042 [Cryptosporidium hominis]CUV07311.1 unnamed protein product [Cryptosporidium hominis]|eukprot:PPS93919.1 Uncharacterized protein GY17_00003042 [Cryptosporidium hominis]